MYKALDLRHHQFDNLKWCEHDSCITCEIDRNYQLELDQQPFPSSSSDPLGVDKAAQRGTKRKRLTDEEESSAVDLQIRLHESKKTKSKKAAYVAIKRIYVTSSPIRIQNELEILANLRDAENVAHLITAFRHEDQILAVMPYEKHHDFRVRSDAPPLGCADCDPRTSIALYPFLKFAATSVASSTASDSPTIKASSTAMSSPPISSSTQLRVKASFAISV